MSTTNPVSSPHESNGNVNQHETEKIITVVLKSPRSNKEESASTAPSTCNFDTLQQAIANLAISMQDIKSDLKNEIKKSSDNNQEKLQQLETRLMTAQSVKHTEITEDMTARFTVQEKKNQPHRCN